MTLLGPSGCGKTTLLRLIAGFLAPDAGAIRVGAVTLSSPAAVVPPERRGMGMVFQSYAIWPHKTRVRQRRLRPGGPAASRAPRFAPGSRACSSWSTSPGSTRAIPSELRGGQQQRVALARSLVVEPAILLLDEPLSNLDAKLRERMRWELKDVQRRTGITFVYVTHDQSEAIALSDRIAVMQKGSCFSSTARRARSTRARPTARWRTSWDW